METQKLDDRIISSHTLVEELKALPEEKILSTGYCWLDKCIEGFALGDLIVIVGEPKTGKSAYAMSITNEMAKLGVKSLWIQAELSYPQFVKRFKGEIPAFYLPRNLSVPTLTWIESKVVEAKKEGIQVVYIDDIGMIADEDMFKYKNAQEIYGARIMRIKRMAVRHGVCVVALWHTDKQSGKKVKKVSMELTDIKGMTDLAYRADTILGLRRMAGTSADRIAQDMLGDDFIFSREADIFILACRRTGVKRMKIRCHMGDDGYYHED